MGADVVRKMQKIQGKEVLCDFAQGIFDFINRFINQILIL